MALGQPRRLACPPCPRLFGIDEQILQQAIRSGADRSRSAASRRRGREAELRDDAAVEADLAGARRGLHGIKGDIHRALPPEIGRFADADDSGSEILTAVLDRILLVLGPGQEPVADHPAHRQYRGGARFILGGEYAQRNPARGRDAGDHRPGGQLRRPGRSGQLRSGKEITLIKASVDAHRIDAPVLGDELEYELAVRAGEQSNALLHGGPKSRRQDNC
ncbi:MAG: hypothetical protein BWY77_00795 [bacterium ADurb.Bin431]|nr:MAG: hypothetical protein BWY77_00795 [bacterium ADurb.Bin431]